MTDPTEVTASPESPRTLRRVADGAEVQCVSQMEYLTLTTAQGYRDVTDEVSGPRGTPGSGQSGHHDAPAQSAPKAAWVDHAVAKGVDKATAEGKTKEQLVADHGA